MEKIKIRTLKIINVMFEYNIFVFLLYINISLAYLYEITNFKINIFNSVSILIANILLIIGTYTINKIYDKNEDTHNGHREILDTNKKNKTLIFLSPLFFALSFVIYLMVEKNNLIIFWFVLFCLSILYSCPKRYRLKNIFLIKNITSAFCWFFSIVILLFVSVSNISLVELIYLLHPVFLLVLTVEIIWDLPDIYGDKLEKVKTLPVVLGFDLTKIIISVVLIFLFLYFNTTLTKMICLILFVFVLNISKNTHKKYYHYLIFLITLLLFPVYLI